MTSLIWFNEDGLNPDHVMVEDYSNSPRVYVFDVPYLQQWQIAKHRVQFIYESLLEIPNIQIYKGETIAVLRQLIDQHDISEVVTTETPNHLIKAWQTELQRYASLITYPEIFPVEEPNPKRFARYWRKHEKAWLTP